MGWGLACNLENKHDRVSMPLLMGDAMWLDWHFDFETGWVVFLQAVIGFACLGDCSRL